MAALTDLRVAVQGALTTSLGIDFHGGAQAGPIEDRDAGFVWIATLAPGEGLEQAVDVRVRVFKQWKQRASYAELDPTDVETLAENLQTALHALRVAPAVLATGFWFLQQVELELDSDTNGVEASVIALRTNPFLA